MKLDSVVEAIPQAVVETNFQAHRKRTRMVPVAAVDHL
jgi:hypothetical protein